MSGRQKDSGKGRKTGERTEEIKYFFIFEGARTEPEYFDMIDLHKNEERVKLKSIVKMMPQRKFGPYYNETGLDKLIYLAGTYRSFLKTKKCSIEYFVSVAMDPTSKRLRKRKMSKEEKRELENELMLKHQMIVNTLKKNRRYLSGVINPNYYTEALRDCKTLIKSVFDDVTDEELSKIPVDCINTTLATPYLEGDVFYVIRDRDYHEYYFPDEKYKDALEIAEKENIQLAISTPMFEYWLLLHHNVKIDFAVDKYSKEKVQNMLDSLENRRDRDDFDNEWNEKEDRKLTVEERDSLTKLQKAIDDSRKTIYLNGFRTAIKRSLEGTHDNESLIESGGTSIGQLFSQMII